MKIPYNGKFITKKKEKSLQKLLKSKIWDIFRQWVYLRDKSTCYTCGKTKLSGADCQAGHLFHGKLDYEPLNIHTQCMKCNHFESGNRGIYTEKIIKEHGIDVYDALKLKSNQTWKPGTQELEDLLHYWSVKLESLKEFKQ